MQTNKNEDIEDKIVVVYYYKTSSIQDYYTSKIVLIATILLDNQRNIEEWNHNKVL